MNQDERRSASLSRTRKARPFSERRGLEFSDNESRISVQQFHSPWFHLGPVVALSRSISEVVRFWFSCLGLMMNHATTLILFLLLTSVAALNAAAPTVISPTVTNIAATSATVGGNVTSDGGFAITARGVVWALTSSNPNPQLGGTGVSSESTSGTTGGVHDCGFSFGASKGLYLRRICHQQRW